MSDAEGTPGGGVLVPAAERVVDFYGDVIPVAQLAEGEIYVPLRPIVEQLGLDWASQYQRVKRDDVLAESIRSVVITTTDRGKRSMVGLPLKHLPGWLFGVSATRVKPELQEKIKRYRRECFDVLWRAFAPAVLPTPPPPVENPGGAVLALEIATAIQHLAQQQLVFEAQLAQMAEGSELAAVRNKQEVMAGYLRGFVQITQDRLTALELRMGTGATISEAQAAEIALAVKEVAGRVAGTGGPNGYQQVYAELYRRYGISSYKNLPAARYQEALAWLRGWDGELLPE